MRLVPFGDNLRVCALLETDYTATNVSRDMTLLTLSMLFWSSMQRETTCNDVKFSCCGPVN